MQGRIWPRLGPLSGVLLTGSTSTGSDAQTVVVLERRMTEKEALVRQSLYVPDGAVPRKAPSASATGDYRQTLEMFGEELRGGKS